MTQTDQTWFGHPRGLTILFLTEMWDQFSFFGMRALLVYYMTKELMIGQAHSSYIYGLYSSFVYFTPLIGGVISDRWLGRRRAVIVLTDTKPRTEPSSAGNSPYTSQR